ncbi:WG repeat-containing protein [Pedobacter punctiformis]|uniref:WG repeat-containing protein n=1 Tax=Pedobacter punctiformis TaxID=3004097 RepID=A0ABT4LDC8_9SPHI|nr:WG repeat-containing protein [Pedobacter sp. HCMS5-2]MCZ4245915.1 WG repeat-containing protein [Pedobacter sp. HCMS5-2]
MKPKFIITVLFASLFLSSCGGQSPEKSQSAKKYIASLQSMKLDDLKLQLKKDTALLNKLIKTATFKMQLTSHFSSGEKSIAKKSVPEFNINYSVPKITEIFNDYCRQLYFNQDFKENYAEEGLNLYSQDRFEFVSRYNLTDDNHIIEAKDSTFKSLEQEIWPIEKTYYFRGKKIAKEDIGLRRIDSIETEIHLKFPLEFEKFTIEKSEKNTKYKSHIIEVEAIKDNMAKLKIPTELYSDIIGYQAYNNQNIRMNSNALSSTPMLEIKSNIKTDLKELLNIFLEVLKSNDENKAKEYLNRINQNHLDAKNNLTEFDAYITGLAKNEEKIKGLGDLTLFKEIADKGKKVITSENQFVIVEFPDNIKTIDVFTATKFASLQNKKNVKFNPNEYTRGKYFDVNNPHIIYCSFVQGEGIKYGISDKDGKKIIDAKYEKPNQEGNDYFIINDKLYWLDADAKKMVSLPEYDNYIQTLKPGYDVFEKSSGDKSGLGVVLNRNKVILPFNYFRFDKYETFIIAHKNADGDDLYDLNLNKLASKEIKKIQAIDEFISSQIKYPQLFIAENDKGKKALTDKNLKFLTPFKFEFINPFFEIKDYYIAGIRTPDDSNYFYGLLDNKGNEVIPFIFDDIDDEQDASGKLKYRLKQKWLTMNFETFLKTYRK